VKDIQIIADAEEKFVRSNESNPMIIINEEIIGEKILTYSVP
jgi:hypothetical protein